MGINFYWSAKMNLLGINTMKLVLGFALGIVSALCALLTHGC
jgi:hypothetical protein